MTSEDDLREQNRNKQRRYLDKNRDTVNARRRIRYQENKEEITAEKRRLRAENPEVARREQETQKRYRERQAPGWRSDYMRRWRADNADSLFAWAQEYRRTHKEQKRMYDHLRRALIRGNEFEQFSEQDVLDQWGTDCHICGDSIDLVAPRQQGVLPGWQDGLHLDHVRPLCVGGGHTLSNVKPSHAVCNLRKSKKWTERQDRENFPPPPSSSSFLPTHF